MTRRPCAIPLPALVALAFLALAALACVAPGTGAAEPSGSLGAVQTQVVQSLTAQAPAGGPGVTVVPANTPAAPTAAPATAASTTAAPTPSVQCYVAIGYASTVLCVDGPNQTQVADTGAIGTVSQVGMSSDGGQVAYIVATIDGQSQLWMVNADGTNARKLADKTNLPPEQADSVTFPHRFHWQAGAHALYFDTGFQPTAGVNGPGEYLNLDLWKLNADSGQLTQVLTAGSGGYFSVSPNGKWLAITRPQDVSLISTDGATVKPNLITFTPVITYSEYAYKPEVTWSLDSAFFSVSIPSKIPQAADASATVYRVHVDGATQTLATYQGHFLFDRSLKISPDGQWAAYVTTDANNAATLHVNNTDGPTGAAEVLTGAPTLSLYGWSPDSIHYAYAVAGDGLYAGTINVNPQVLALAVQQVKDVIWSDPNNVVFSGIVNGHWGLYTAAIGGIGAQDFAGPFGAEMVFGVR